MNSTEHSRIRLNWTCDDCFITEDGLPVTLLNSLSQSTLNQTSHSSPISSKTDQSLGIDLGKGLCIAHCNNNNNNEIYCPI